ncbi:MAG: nuclear transport factor 2 family protein [Clostridium sp.]|nr:nuclear transport factor 2 family protein [Clostridium sp.]
MDLILNYIMATYESHIPLLSSCFPESAKMTGYLGDTLVDGTPEPFFEDMASGPSMALGKEPYEAEIQFIHITGRTASAAVHETGFRGNTCLTDYFQLLKLEDGSWKIVSKTFTTTEQ